MFEESGICWFLGTDFYELGSEFLDESDLDKVKEELKMTVLGKMLMEDGRAEGEKSALEKEAIGLLDVLSDETIAQKLNLSLEYVKELRAEYGN